MSVVFNPDLRESEQQALDYAAYCLIRTAALAIRERTEVLPDSTMSGLNFRAVDMSIDLPDPAYAALCRDMHVSLTKFGAREKLVINLQERSLVNDSAYRHFFYRQIGIRTKNEAVYRSWRTIYFPWAVYPMVHERVIETEQQVQAMLGAFMLHEAVVSHPLVRGDTEHIVRELDQFAQGA